MALCTYDESTRTWHGPRLTPIFNLEASVGQVMNDILLRSPERIIQIDMDTDSRLSCAEFRTRMIRLAQNLTEVCGLKWGDMVAVANGNSENIAPLVCALMTIGTPFNPLSPYSSEEDMAHMLQLVQPKVIFCEDVTVEVVRAAASRSLQWNPAIYVVESKRDDVLHFEDLLKPTGREEQFVPQHVGNSRENLAMILCSSGTTGPPKGVRVTHAQVICTIGSYPLATPMTVFIFSPMYWATGVVMLLSTFANGSTRLTTRSSFAEEVLFKAVEKYRASFVFLLPACAKQVICHERVGEVDFSSVRLLALGGAYVSDPVRDRFDRLLPNGRTLNAHGTSEIGWVACDIAERKPAAVGTPTANVIVRICDEEGNDLGVGERGQILLKNCEVRFTGYYRNEEATRKTIDSRGFVRTGDVGYFDDEGYLYIVDRMTDIFKSFGRHVSPSALEDVVGQLEGVAEVCVVAVPADEYRSTEIPMALIVRSDGSALDAEEVHKFVEAKLEDHMRLRGGVQFVESLPKTQNGKLLRRKVTEMLGETMAGKGASGKR